MKNNDTLYSFTARTMEGEEISLSQYSGKVLLIVNTASKCGFTPQYEGLQKLYEDLKDTGFTILGFPCNQFGRQEPGTSEDIKSFCETNYHITFPIFEKIKVNGGKATPLFKFLKDKARGILGLRRIQWNFTKFLISPEGRVLRRFAPAAKPESIKHHIEELLQR